MERRGRAHVWIALVLPFIAGGLVLRGAVAPLGDSIARSLTRAVTFEAGAPNAHGTSIAHGTPITDNAALASTGGDEGVSATSGGGLPRRIASSRSGPPHRAAAAIEEAKDAGATDAGRAPSLTDPPKGTIVVPAAAVTRAIEKRNVAATNAVAPDGTPLGARLAGVSRHGTGLRDGDVVVSVNGTRTATVDAMVAAGLAAANGGATRIFGRIVRGDAVYAVVLELPKPPP